MATLAAKSKIQESTITGRIIRADGTIEELGVMVYYNSNPFKMLFHKLKSLLNK